MKDTVHELIIVIANQGNIELIMDAARGAGAYGGTVIHARGTGMELAEKFMGVSIAAEKEMIFIVTKKDQKNGIMKAIMENAGMDTKAKSIVFSLKLIFDQYLCNSIFFFVYPNLYIFRINKIMCW